MSHFLDLNNEVINMTRDIGIYKERLIRIQHALIDLINFLDHGMIRFDGKNMEKYNPDDSYQGKLLYVSI